jgi:thymidylate synthase
MNLILKGKPFNSQYLMALKAALSGRFPSESSRAGDVTNIGQAYFEINHDDPRLIFLNKRKLNPAFAIVEAAWILAGRNDVATLTREIKSFSDYSDDATTLNGAYGYRLRNHFQKDQIELALNELKKNPESRRVVLTIYSPEDLGKKSSDIPCNTTLYLKINSGSLDITVLNRSNDLYRGIPYNVFVFGVLQRLMALSLGIQVGIQRHFTDGLHLYDTDIEKARDIVNSNNEDNVNNISNQFDFDYTSAVIENYKEIADGNYDKIRSDDLKNFLTQFCAQGRVSTRKNNEEFRYPLNFLGLVTYQWIENFPQEEKSAWGKIRKKLAMKNEIRQQFASLGEGCPDEIAIKVNEMAILLKGNYSALKSISEENSPLGLKDFGNNEELALKTLILNLILTTFDPFLAGSLIGERMKQNIFSAAFALGVSSNTIGPISSLENPLFEALDKILHKIRQAR